MLQSFTKAVSPLCRQPSQGLLRHWPPRQPMSPSRQAAQSPVFPASHSITTRNAPDDEDHAKNASGCHAQVTRGKERAKNHACMADIPVIQSAASRPARNNSLGRPGKTHEGHSACGGASGRAALGRSASGAMSQSRFFSLARFQVQARPQNI